ncbi:MAG: ABC transporter ATP-binding protein/permease [Candidatus Saccharibacteria bacterium]|nr:ABC transporter ATP-binding protein/permease [Candidatus Saccharibacteria bacterium]
MPSRARSKDSNKASRRAQRKARKADERKRPEYPRIDFKSILYCMKIYRKAVGPRRYFFWFYRVVSSVTPALTAVIAGYVVTCISDAVVSPTHDLTSFIVAVAILLSVQFITIVLYAIYRLLSISASQETYIYVSELVATKYIQIPLAMRETQEFADKFERVREFGLSIDYVSTSAITVASSVISLISIIVATLVVSPFITVAILIAAIPSSILSLRIAARERRNWREFTKDRRIASAIERKITNSDSALEIELNGLSKHLVLQMIKARRRSQEQDIADNKAFFLPRFGADILQDVVGYIVLIIVAIQIIHGRLAIGQFLTVRTLLSQLNNNISSFFESITAINTSLVNATDFMEFMETPAQHSGDIGVNHLPKIEFKHVSFMYPHSDHFAIEDVSFTLNPGDSLAIVGENGAGKTTLIKLLIGAYMPQEGMIYVDDHPISEIDRESYLGQIGALFQDYSRYDFATLGENVWFGNVEKPYSRKAIMEALDDAGLGNLAIDYKNGLNQLLSKDIDAKNATNISGGQWQRLGIARAFFRSPNILILDEPTSSVDAKSEYEIFRSIIKKQQGKSTVIISHRFSTVRRAEKIIVLDHGKIIEQGTHSELIAQDGVYKEMFELQAEGYA